MINIRPLKDKLEHKQGQMGNVNREMEILRKKQKEILKIKNTNRNEDCFDGFISRLDTTLKKNLSLKTC